MQIRHSLILTGIAAVGAGAAPSASAQTIDVTVNIPRMSVAEYHQPYVAIWIEKAGAPARTLSVWYDYDKAKGEGKKWLNDLRSWWRASGRSLTLPADGVSGATRAPGDQKISFTAGKGPLGAIAPGDYTLAVEAAREVGGREVVRVPFSWPPKPGSTARAAGSTELGAVTLGFRK
ncbi:DUF2271 domain-containing protein [Sphingobium phenoxybenzoativorans]|uniref:DUF2271 domain-containing protein n=1 Tax=Sphingobium phenoxybenzoativorans TaxID=1592790 RepID=A0A975K7T1_9SPHN|nr:DUF2271 domain-containing protein [Sphingobium phenoxybenzoativorans]QUT06376.1 DUF2271 domain-containing protein [Sphingobium phenoxybenzoativorans]